MWLPGGWADYLHWQESDRKILRRINEVIRDVLVYRVQNEIVIIMQCRFHYED